MFLILEQFQMYIIIIIKIKKSFMSGANINPTGQNTV